MRRSHRHHKHHRRHRQSQPLPQTPEVLESERPSVSEPVQAPDQAHSQWEIPDEEVEDYLAAMPEEETKRRFWNLPNIAGLSILAVGLAYLLQQLGLWQGGVDVSFLVSMLPWIGILLILLIGTGLLQRSSSARVSTSKPRRNTRKKRRKPRNTFAATSSHRKRLTKSRDRKIAGVCGGIAEYFGLDPTLVRAIFALGMFISGGQLILLYFFLAFIMPRPEPSPAR